MYKSFGITKALKGVRLVVNRGEVLGLIGENGSGKSTLTSIIAGIQPADSGKITYEGAPYSVSNSVEANEKGVCMILQEKGTFDNLSVAHNIFIGNEKRFVKNGIINERAMFAEARKVLDSIGATHIDVRDKIGTRSFEDGKLVELARAEVLSPKILIVDETTTALSQNGRTILYDMIRRIKERDGSVIFISHDIDEMMLMCDRLSVLRDGDYVGSLNHEEFSAAAIKKMMVGREISDNYYRADLECSYEDKVMLRVDQVTSAALKGVSLEVHKGEILGIGGLADSGMHDLGKAAFGAITLIKGKVVHESGKEVDSPGNAMKLGIAYIAKNRDQESLFINAPIRDNVAIASYSKLVKKNLLLPSEEKKFVSEWTSKMEVKMRDINQYVSELSGGNKQKVVMSKWLGFGADIFIFDCPTRGIDIGVKASIYRLMEDLKKQGKAIVLISEELPEIIGMSDRIVIMKDGSVNGIFRRSGELTEHQLIEYMV